MGKVEKVIVLSVLFLIALILVVSLTVDDPLNKTRIVEAGAPPARPAAALHEGDAVAQVPPQGSSIGLLSAPVGTQPLVGAPASPAPAGTPAPTSSPAPVQSPALTVTEPVATLPSLPPGALLKKLDGLQDSILPDMKLYTWKEGDTYRLIAERYYGNKEKFTVLRRSNEGRTDVKPGQNIFVPVFDTDAYAAVPIDPAGSTPSAPDANKTPKVKKGADAAAKESPKPSGKKVHVVKEGESLWKIAKEELGSGSRWKEIYEVNKDVLASPEAVHKGIRLRIP